MRLYNIKDDYINYLKNFDPNISENKNQKRPYIGVVIEISDIKYYAPLTSPKPKHAKMKNSKDFRKIKNGEYGAINFNKMIPVPESALILKDIENEPNQKYKRLLQNQYVVLKEDFPKIQSTAAKLRELVLTDSALLTPFDIKIKDRCCNFELLEKFYAQYDEFVKNAALYN